MSTDEPNKELDGSKMSFLCHLKELRQRIFYTLAGMLIGTLICFSWAPEMFELLRHPLAGIQDQQMIVIGPLEMFITYLKLSVLAGVFLTSPWILAQIWFFISPGLYSNEKKWLAPFVGLGSLFFSAVRILIEQPRTYNTGFKKEHQGNGHHHLSKGIWRCQESRKSNRDDQPIFTNSNVGIGVDDSCGRQNPHCQGQLKDNPKGKDKPHHQRKVQAYRKLGRD